MIRVPLVLANLFVVEALVHALERALPKKTILGGFLRTTAALCRRRGSMVSAGLHAQRRSAPL